MQVFKQFFEQVLGIFRQPFHSRNQVCREDERLSLYCRRWPATSFTIGASSASQPIAAHEWAYDDGALCMIFCHMDHAHWTSSGSVGDYGLSKP